LLKCCKSTKPCRGQVCDVVYEGMHFHEHVKGTILHLQVIQAFLEVFYGQGTLLEWVEWSSFVMHMIYFGIEYIHNVNMDTTCKIIGWLTSPLLIVWFFVIQ
jgi:hypothetical protein